MGVAFLAPLWAIWLLISAAERLKNSVVRYLPDVSGNQFWICLGTVTTCYIASGDSLK